MTLWASVFTRLKPYFQPGAVFPFAFELAEPEAAPGVGEWTSAWESGARCLLPGGRLGFCFAVFLLWVWAGAKGKLLEAWSLGPLVPWSPVPFLGRSALEVVPSAAPVRTHSTNSAVEASRPGAFRTLLKPVRCSHRLR